MKHKPMKHKQWIWLKSPRGVSRPLRMKLVPWWNGREFDVARRYFSNLYRIYQVLDYE